MKGKWITASILIVALLGLGAIAAYTIIAGVSAVNSRGFQVEINGTSAFSAESDEQQRMNVDEAPSLVVDNSSGNITVVGGAAGEIIVSAHKKAYADSQKKADADLQALDIQITQQGNAVTVRVPQSPTVICMGFCRPDTVDFTITVPEGTKVEARTASGNVSTSGIGGEAHLFSAYGDIRADQLEGTLEAKTSSGKVDVQNVSGGNVDLRSDYGNVTLSQADVEQVHVSTQSGEIRLTDVTASGDMTLDDSYGNITFKSGGAATLTVDASSGAIKLSDLMVSTVIAHSDYGDVQVDGVSAQSYDLSSSSGKVTADGVRGRLKVEDDYGDIIVRNAEDITLDLNTSSGKVEFQGSLGAGPHTLHSSYGDILLVIPAATALFFDLKTDYGKITSTIPVSITGEINEDHWVGTTNSGGVNFTASTNSGDIRIEILNP
jgi:DUF4097 and DUF4098 domain-containing protein YvlB